MNTALYKMKAKCKTYTNIGIKMTRNEKLSTRKDIAC